MIHNLKPLVTLRVVNTADIDAALKLALRMIPQKSQDRYNSARGNVKRKFVLVNRELLNKLGERLHKVGSVCVEGFCGFCMLDYCRIWRGGFGERRDRGWGNIEVDWNIIPMDCSESHLSKMTRSECTWNTLVMSVGSNAKRERLQRADGQHHQRIAVTLSRTGFGRAGGSVGAVNNQSCRFDSCPPPSLTPCHTTTMTSRFTLSSGLRSKRN